MTSPHRPSGIPRVCYRGIRAARDHHRRPTLPDAPGAHAALRGHLRAVLGGPWRPGDAGHAPTRITPVGVSRSRPKAGKGLCVVISSASSGNAAASSASREARSAARSRPLEAQSRCATSQGWWKRSPREVEEIAEGIEGRPLGGDADEAVAGRFAGGGDHRDSGGDRALGVHQLEATRVGGRPEVPYQERIGPLALGVALPVGTPEEIGRVGIARHSALSGKASPSLGAILGA